MKSKALFIVCSMMLASVACAPKETGNASGDSSSSRSSKPITVKGSDTMVVLGQRFAEEYMKASSGAVVQVNGGGSGTGISALINGTVDLAQSSRTMKDQEKKDVEAKRGSPVVEVPVAIDALAIFVHEANPLKQLSLGQIASIYTGKVKNWKEIGGKDAPLVLYGRESSSGTYDYFREHVLNRVDFATNVQTLQGTAAIVNAVGKDPNGIGYGGIAYSSGVRAIGVQKDPGSPAVSPSDATVADQTYPLSRKLFFYHLASIRDEVKQFTAWATSAEGQAVVKNVGYFPLNSVGAGQAGATDTAATTTNTTATTGS